MAHHLPTTTQPPKLRDRLRMSCRARHYSPRTADAYHHWCRRVILFHGLRHPREMAEPEFNPYAPLKHDETGEIEFARMEEISAATP